MSELFNANSNKFGSSYATNSLEFIFITGTTSYLLQDNSRMALLKILGFPLLYNNSVIQFFFLIVIII